MASSRDRNADKRRSPRRKLGVPAKIYCGGGEPVQTCVLSDISATGARLVTITAADLPDQFDLLLAGPTGPRRRASVVWRTRSAVGIRFVRE